MLSVICKIHVGVNTSVHMSNLECRLLYSKIDTEACIYFSAYSVIVIHAMQKHAALYSSGREL
jgi:hypothetical protein